MMIRKNKGQLQNWPGGLLGSCTTTDEGILTLHRLFFIPVPAGSSNFLTIF